MYNDELTRRYGRTLAWLLSSCHANAGRGSSAWRSPYLHPIRRWSAPYPETTGYLIPTLYDAVTRVAGRASEIRELIPKLVDWLLEMQLPDGAFPGGHQVRPGHYRLTTMDYLLHRDRPPMSSIFNSGQILLGLVRHSRETGDVRTTEAVERCSRFLVSSIQEDGSWANDAYATTTSPAYFTHVSWPILEASQLLGSDDFKGPVVRTLDAVIRDRDEKTAYIYRTGFQAADRAHTHTLAYTLYGLLQSAVLLGEESNRFFEAAEAALQRIFRIGELRKRLPGAFDRGWKADWSYNCITGNAQIGLCYMRVFEKQGDPRFLNAACRLFSNVARVQARGGAVPGSSPIWGSYMSFRWPNWAAKFYMDLMVELDEKLTAEAAR